MNIRIGKTERKINKYNKFRDLLLTQAIGYQGLMQPTVHRNLGKETKVSKCTFGLSEFPLNVQMFPIPWNECFSFNESL